MKIEIRLTQLDIDTLLRGDPVTKMILGDVVMILHEPEPVTDEDRSTRGKRCR